MTTKEHIKALEEERKALISHIEELESDPERHYIRMRETIQYERELRQKAEARADALHKELNHWKSEFIREGSMPNSEINARIEAYSQRIEQAEARAADSRSATIKECAKVAYEMKDAPGVEISPGRVSLAILIGDKILTLNPDARAAALAIAKKVADAAVEYDQAKTDYDVGEAYGNLSASVVEKMLSAHSEMRKTAREYRVALNPDTREEGESE